MDKASRALRRSSVKLLSLGGSHTDLNVLLSEVRDTRNSAKAFMNAQNIASNDLMKWAAKEENRAIQDVISQMNELNLLWTEVQREFVERLKEYRQMFEMVLEGEKGVTHAKNHMTACEQKEVKVRKELKKASKKCPAEDIRILQARLSQAERSKELAEVEVSDRIRENEVVKLIRLKEGFLRMSEAYVDLGKRCSIIFTAQREVARQLPDVHSRDIEDIKYTGAGTARHFVQAAKERVKNYKSQTSQVEENRNEPPPPYTPSLCNSSSEFDSGSDTSPFSTPQGPEGQGAELRRPTPAPRQQQSSPVEDVGSDSEEEEISGAMGGASVS